MYLCLIMNLIFEKLWKCCLALWVMRKGATPYPQSLQGPLLHLGFVCFENKSETTIFVGKSGFHYKKDPKIVYGAKRWQTYVRTGSIYLCGFLSSQYNREALRIYFWGKLVRLDCRDLSSICSPNFLDRVVGRGERHPCWTSFSYLNIDCVTPLKWSEC